MSHALPPATGAPSRRRFVACSAAIVLSPALPGCSRGPGFDRQLQFPSLAAAGDELARLAQAKVLQSDATWNWAQTLNHCAQSIEFSMSGFPEPKSALFQQTIGSAAVAVFSWRGRMTHDLSEPIPGAPALDAKADAAQAMGRLRASMQAFAGWSGPLRPHFAYGDLDKPAYEHAHAMHIANHLSAFRIGSNAG